MMKPSHSTTATAPGVGSPSVARTATGFSQRGQSQILCKKLEALSHHEADTDPVFEEVRDIGKEFASGLKLLFFDRENDENPIANLSLEYVGF